MGSAGVLVGPCGVLVGPSGFCWRSGGVLVLWVFLVGSGGILVGFWWGFGGVLAGFWWVLVGSGGFWWVLLGVVSGLVPMVSGGF